VELANQHTSIEYTLVLALVLVLLAPIAAAEIVAGDRVEDELQAPCSTGAPARGLRDGRRSDLQPSFESAAYRYELLEPPGRGDYSDLDGPTVGRVSDHAFRLPPGIIVRAEIQIRLQPVAFLATNDLLYLGSEDDRRSTFLKIEVQDDTTIHDVELAIWTYARPCDVANDIFHPSAIEPAAARSNRPTPANEKGGAV
jgi:hypothetical protein